MHPALHTTDHRPWPLPERPWRWRQSWHDLLFAHWPVPVGALRALVPKALEIEEFDGSAWLGVIPFHMSGVTLRPLPPLPGLSAFPELNVRTYVRHGGKPGVWFFSLDAGNRIAVEAARRWFHLPYHLADMSVERREGWIEYRSERRDAATSAGGDAATSADDGGATPDRDADDTAPRLFARYRPSGPVSHAAPGSIAHWLTERYCLYAVDARGGLHRTEIHHPPWPLQPGAIEIEVNEMARPLGITLDVSPPLVHYAERLDVVVWSLEQVED